MSNTKRLSTRRRSAADNTRAALARLRADPAVRGADPATRQWLLTLLSNGDTAEKKKRS
jgi:hypothetical protein